MAPVKDQVVDDLKNLVHRLQARVEDLEAKLSGEGSSSSSAESGVRMILMGPPGAGMQYPSCWCCRLC
jgi:adenylate kinase